MRGWLGFSVSDADTPQHFEERSTYGRRPLRTPGTGDPRRQGHSNVGTLDQTMDINSGEHFPRSSELFNTPYAGVIELNREP